VRAIILTGAGEKSFVAGADIAEIAELSNVTGKEFSKRGNALYSFIESMTVPVIAAINGFALGGGCELAMACHLRIASEKAKFGQPEINLGIIPGYGGTQRLPRLVGRGRALELMLTGNMIGAPEALSFGLVNSVSAPENLLAEAQKLAAELAAKAPLATQAILESVHIGLQQGLELGLKYEETQFAFCCGTDDKNEGAKAFLEKRKPEFAGK
jgi:enoyl-CoA hydratase